MYAVSEDIDELLMADSLNSGESSLQSLLGKSDAISGDVDAHAERWLLNYGQPTDGDGEFGSIPSSSNILVRSVESLESVFENMDGFLMHEYQNEAVLLESSGNEKLGASLCDKDFVRELQADLCYEAGPLMG